MEDAHSNKDREEEKDPTKIDFQAEDIVGLPSRFFKFLKSTLDIRSELDIPNSITTMRSNTTVQGSAIWILVCSIVIASIGLNFDSTAVIIGAMLISPLMGPIRGAGLALATNDFKLLISAVKNYGVMIVVSLTAALIYFLLTPIKGDTNELLGRVKPQAFDILIAFFGGFAGVVATVSNNKSAAMTIVPGVAIATALMPPICTAGYGLASGQWNYALGAFYLFTLNSVFICLSTILLLRVLKFPLKDFVNPRTERRVKWYILIVLLLIVIPSIYKTVIIVRESIFINNADSFVEHVIQSDENLFVTSEYDFSGDVPVIRIFSNGTEISETEKQMWRNQLKNYDLEDVIIQVKDRKQDLTHVQTMADYKSKIALLEEQKAVLYNESKTMKSKFEYYKEANINMQNLGEKVKATFPLVKGVSFGKSINYSESSKLDTSYNFTILWKDTVGVNKEVLRTYQSSISNLLVKEIEQADSVAKDKKVVISYQY